MPANAGPYKHEFRGLLFDGLCICEGLQLSKDHILQSLADCDADWIVLPVELYHPPGDLPSLLDDMRPSHLGPGWDETPGPDMARLAAACNYSQQTGVTRYWVLEQGDDLENNFGFGDWIFVDIDASGAIASSTIFSAHAWGALVRYSKELWVKRRDRRLSAEAMMNKEPTTPPGNRLESLALLETFEEIARGHVWACRVTEAVHISRFLLFVFMALQNSMWMSIPAHLIDFGRRIGPPERRTCRCAMPEGLVAPYPPPWVNGRQERQRSHHV